MSRFRIKTNKKHKRCRHLDRNSEEKTCSCVVYICNSFRFVHWIFQLCICVCMYSLRFIFYRWVLLNKQWMTLSGDGNQIVEWTRWQLSETYQKPCVCIFVGKCVVIPMFKIHRIHAMSQKNEQYEAERERATEIFTKWFNARKRMEIEIGKQVACRRACVQEHEMMMQMNGCKIYASSPRNIETKDGIENLFAT